MDVIMIAWAKDDESVQPLDQIESLLTWTHHEITQVMDDVIIINSVIPATDHVLVHLIEIIVCVPVLQDTSVSKVVVATHKDSHLPFPSQ